MIISYYNYTFVFSSIALRSNHLSSSLGSFRIPGNFDIPVVSLTSDGANPNWHFNKMCQQKTECVHYKTFNLFQADNVFFFCDVPHLLKTVRNSFSNYFSCSQSCQMHVIFPFLSYMYEY